ncbi:MAG: PaaI family thioesterase [Ktedonobacterales bacterium]|nr:PaaI family thioesterase [Ktedonobacterales bacterium]
MDDATHEHGAADYTHWLNDDTDFQQCFVCGQRNPFGLQLVFRSDGTRIMADFMGEARHQGFPGVVHGGILASILDEAMGRVSVLEHRWAMTGKLELRYRAPAPINVTLRVFAEATDSRSRLIRVKGWIARVDDPSVIVCEAEGLFLPLPKKVRDEAVANYPGLADFFPPATP